MLEDETPVARQPDATDDEGLPPTSSPSDHVDHVTGSEGNMDMDDSNSETSENGQSDGEHAEHWYSAAEVNIACLFL